LRQAKLYLEKIAAGSENKSGKAEHLAKE
jgi:hypothetical protein